MRGKWIENLPIVLYIDRVTVRCSTGYSLYRLVYGYEITLVVELDIPIYTTLPFYKVKTIAKLLALRARQL